MTPAPTSTTRPIDEKIVVMKLDNSDFKKKATETTSIFGKLKSVFSKAGSSSDLDKVTKDIGNISSAANKVDMSKLASSVDMISGRFTNLGVVATTALANIANRAVDAGINIAKSLTFDQVNDGFKEYELKMGSIQTILANTQKDGTTLDDVYKSFDKLNAYADQTIYSFADMTKNIGLFTNAGLKLEESTSMIQGFSNAAAASGAGAEEAARAAYQLSQGLASGYIMQMDWMSLTNAGMGNDNMKRDLIALGQALGTLNVDTETAVKNWKDLLSDEQWLTADVMSTYLQAMAGDLDKATLMSKGLSEAQADLLLQNAKTGEEAATYVRTFSAMMDGLKESIGSGWATTWELIFGDFEQATVFWTKLSKQIGSVFEKSSKSRNDMLKGLADGGGITNVFDGIQNAIKPITQIFSAMGDGFKKAFPPKSVSELIALTKSFKDFTAGLAIGNDKMKQLTTIFQGAFSVFSTIITLVGHVGKAMINMIPDGVGSGILGLLENLANMAIKFNESVKSGNGLTSMIDAVGKGMGMLSTSIFQVISDLGGFVASIFNNIGPALDWVKNQLAPVASWFKEAFSGMDGEGILGAGTAAGIIGVLTMFGVKIWSFFDTFGEMGENFGEALEGVKDAIQDFAMGIKIANLVLIAGAITAVAISLKLMEGVDSEDLTKGITALAVSLGVMMAGLAIISKYNLVGGLGASATLVAIAAAVGLMAISLKALANVDPEELKTGIIGLVSIVGALTVAILAISKLGGTIKTGSLQLVALATSILILTQAVKSLSKIKPGDLKKSLISLGIIFAELAIFLKVVNGSKLNVSTAIGLVGMAAAIQIMVDAISKISELNVNELAIGLGTIAIILTEIALFSKFAGGPQMILAGTGIAMIAGALLLLVPSIQSLGGMSWEELIKGLGGMALALTAVAGAGLLASGAIGGAVAITVLAVALNLLMIPINQFSQMSWDEILKGFIGLGGALGIVAGASVLLTPAIPSMLGFGVAVGLLGAAVLAVGAGLALFGAGLATLATLTAASVAAIVSALGLLLQGFADLIPAVVDFIVKLTVALLDGIETLIPKLVNTVLTLITSLLKAISTHLPQFLELGVKIIVQLIEGIASQAPILIEAGIKLIIDLLNGIANAIETYGPELISAFLRIFGEIILLVVESGVQTVDALFGWIPGVSEAAKAVGESAEKYIRDHFGAKEVADEKGKEFNTSLINASEGARTAGASIANAAKEGVSSVDFATAGLEAGNKYALGISQSNDNVFTAAHNLGTIADRAINQRMQIQSPSKVTEKSGKWTGEGFAKGIKSKGKKVKKTAKDIAAEAQKGFREKMEDLEFQFEIGKIDTKGHIDGIKKLQKQYAKYPKIVHEANKAIKKIEEDALKDSFDKSKEYIEHKKYYNKMSLEDELRAWERMQNTYKKGTEQRKQADREVYRLKKELVENEKRLLKEAFDKSKTYIDDRKYYNEMSLKSELEAWQRVQARYKKGTDERKEADKEVYRLKKEMYQKMVDLNEEYFEKVKETNQKLIDEEKALNDKYESELESRTKDIRSGLGGIFAEFKIDSEVSGTKLLDNLRSQLNGMMNWSRQLKELAAKGIDEGLLEELRQMGPSAASEIAALTKMSSIELSEYSNIWRATNELARHEAVGELAGMREDIDGQIAELHKKSKEQLDEYKDEWLKQMREIREGTPEEFDGLDATMESIGEDAMKGLLKGLKEMEGPLVDQAKSIAKSVSNTIGQVLGASIGNSDISGLGSKAGNAVKNAMTNVLDNLKLNKEINVKAVVEPIDESTLTNPTVKMGARSVVPEVSYTNRMLSSINHPTLAPNRLTQPTPQKADNGADIRGLTAAVAGLVDRPQVTNVYLDGRQISDNIGNRQYRAGAVQALMRG